MAQKFKWIFISSILLKELAPQFTQNTSIYPKYMYTQFFCLLNNKIKICSKYHWNILSFLINGRIYPEWDQKYTNDLARQIQNAIFPCLWLQLHEKILINTQKIKNVLKMTLIYFFDSKDHQSIIENNSLRIILKFAKLFKRKSTVCKK